MSFLVRLIVGVIAVWLTVALGHAMGIGLEWKGPFAAFIFVVALAVVNAVIRPIVKLLTLPLNCMTFGLLAFVINALLFWGTAYLTKGLAVKGFVAALFGSIVLTVLSGIMNSLVKPVESSSRS